MSYVCYTEGNLYKWDISAMLQWGDPILIVSFAILFMVCIARIHTYIYIHSIYIYDVHTDIVERIKVCSTCHPYLQGNYQLP